MGLTLAMLTVLAVVFLIGFREAIQLAAAVAIPYLLLNVIVLAVGLLEIFRHRELLSEWRLCLTAHGDWTGLFLASALIFPKLALGLSGFETGVSVMPLVAGGEQDAAESEAANSRPPWGRIRNSRNLLALA